MPAKQRLPLHAGLGVVVALFQSVGDIGVVERQGVAVLAEGGGGVAVPESLLGLEELPVGDEDCRDGVPQPVQRARTAMTVTMA